jgi:hypothetical protein
MVNFLPSEFISLDDIPPPLPPSCGAGPMTATTTNPPPLRDVPLSVNLFCDGVEPSRFQGTDRRPFVDSLCLEARSGGGISPKTYHTPLLWRRSSSPNLIKTLTMWLEDDAGQRVLFHPDSVMIAEITWRAWARDPPVVTDELEGTVVVTVTVTGDSGSWHMGGVQDWTGLMRKGEGLEPPDYDVAVLAATMTGSGGCSPAAITVTADDWLERSYEGNMLVMPALHRCLEEPPFDDNGDDEYATPPSTPRGPERSSNSNSSSIAAAASETRRSTTAASESVFTFAPPLPRYKRIRAVPVDQTRFRFRPVYTSDPGDRPFTIHRAKLVLRIRRSR